MGDHPLATLGKKLEWQGLFWAGILVLFTLLDVRTFVLHAAGFPALLHAGSFHWNWFLVLIQSWHAILLLSFLVSAASLIARSRLAIILGVAQVPWRLLCSYRSLEGLPPMNAFDSSCDNGLAVAELLGSVGIEAVRILLTIYAIRFTNRHETWLWPTRSPRKRAAFAITVLLAFIVLADRREYGLVRWRLDDGSLLWVTPIDESSYWLGRAYGVNTSLMRQDVPGKLTAAECRHDASGNYWVLASAGEEMAKYPHYFNTERQEYGPPERWEGAPPMGDLIAPARSALLPF
jgi:hypothetical protein